MTSVEKPTTALNVELPGKQGCFQLPRLANIGIHHNGAAPYRQHIYTSTQCRRRTRCTSSLHLEDDVCETMPWQLQQGRCLGSRMPSRSSSSAGMRRGAPQRFSRRISALGDVKRSEGPIIKSAAMRFQLCLSPTSRGGKLLRKRASYYWRPR